jgi:diaminopimelate decarboxylase
VAAYFNKGMDILDAIGPHLSPVYVFEKDMIGLRARAFSASFEHRLPDTGFYFAMKSNNCPDVSAAVLEHGFGLDVSSGVELAVALELGAGDIVFSGPGKTDRELDLAVRNNDKVVVLVDSFGELDRLARIADGKRRTVAVGVRINAEPHGLWRKFGIPVGDLERFITVCAGHEFVEFQGLQFHTSWNMGPERQVAFIGMLGESLGRLSEHHLKMVRFLDIGGGYWPESGEWIQPAATPEGLLRKALDKESWEPLSHYYNPASTIERFAEELSRAVSIHIHSRIPWCRICFEPGRWICHDAMHIFLRVVDCKPPDLVITDGGTNALGWERYEMDYFPVLNLSRPAMKETPCLVLGSLCTPHDVWGYSYWGEAIREGDILMIPTQGAYTYSLRQQFIKDVPEVLVYP